MSENDTRDMLTISRPDGSVIVHRLDPITDIDRARLDALFDGADINFVHMLLALGEQLADEQAYQRVCERRGVLAL